ncbi:MAG: hypothetical protein LQ351_007941 [Letrouitia transgressa]|nr:MAG: hypothetical protein LQ351_007941 [Letrouitia transgressa]
MSRFDRIPNELVYEILSYAMTRNTSFSVSDCIRTAKLVESSKKSKNDSGSQLVEDDQYFEMSAEAFCSDKLRSSFLEERRERERKQISVKISQSPWPLYDLSIEIQQEHLLDWRVAGSVCKRLRRLGKRAFFSSKIFAMDLNLAKRLQESSLTRLSTEDQRTASRYINSIILVYHNLQSPSAFITLPHRVAGFPFLKRLYFFFGGRTGDPLVWSRIAAKARMQPPSHFIDVLSTIGLPTEKLDIGIFISPDTNWSVCESSLKKNIYPILRVYVDRRTKNQSKEIEK